MQEVERKRGMIINIIYLAMILAIGFLVIRSQKKRKEREA